MKSILLLLTLCTFGGLAKAEWPPAPTPLT